MALREIDACQEEMGVLGALHDKADLGFLLVGEEEEEEEEGV